MIQTIERKKGPVYKARVELRDGTRVSQTFSKKADAQKWERAMYAKKGEIDRLSLEKSKMKLDDFFRIWFENKEPNIRPSTIQGYLSQYNLHISPILGQKPIGEIRALDGYELKKCLLQKGSSFLIVGGSVSRLL